MPEKAKAIAEARNNPRTAMATEKEEKRQQRRRRNLEKDIQVARLFDPAIFEASKLRVLFLGVDEKKHPGNLPRAYTLTHCDITSKLTLAISQTINNAQLEQPQWQGQGQQQQQQKPRPFRGQSECRIESLSALEPSRRIESEAGVTEFWDENNEQLDCAGRGMTGAIMPGCPETFQSFQQSKEARGQRSDHHQKIRQFRQGDIIALPAGVAHWCYNDGETPLVLVAVLDTSNHANQLDRNLRGFQLAGSQQRETSFEYHTQRPTGQQRSSSNNIFSGFDVQILAEAFGVSTETARKLQSQDDKRGNIVRVENGLQVVRPRRGEEDEEEQEQGGRRHNGLEETLCNMRLMANIANPDRADVYSPQGGRITSLNSQKLPILNYLQLSAERGVLYRNALLAPHWNLNAHSVIYVTRGNAHVQIVGNSERPVYNGDLRQGQLLIVPQNFAVVKQAGNEGFEWVAFKTNDNAMISPLAGRTSAIRAMPEEVLVNAFRISREEARRLKFNREEVTILSPRSRAQGRASV
ncbi:hypothetical protein HHK36_026898 [Tetracentron sinense]|uniref:Cupin type-1 domain-containing protein n=1 Tax=Tetracentron sinense TaxID=13715 RepID=A0A835D520_TETSI|nr:hypothetical protein HHK36_026898 [Tetracentron sinense]